MRNFADQRVLKSTPATLSAQFVDQDGTAVAPVGAITVGITRADGSTLLAAGTATTAPGGVGVAAVALTAAQTTTLDHLTCTWTAASGEVVVTHVDVVGAFAFSLSDLQALDGMVTTTTERRRQLRQAVEELVEERTGWLWTRRLVVESFPAYTNGGPAFGSTYGANGFYLMKQPVKALRSVKVDNVAQTLGINGWTVNGEWGRLSTVAGYTGLTTTAQAVEVAYEAGEDRPPASLVNALLEAAAQAQRDRASGASSRQLSIVNEFGNVNFARATVENLFGNPAVDAVLALWDRRIPGMA